MSTFIAFPNRSLSDLLNQKLVQLARDNPKFDVDLVSTNGQVVPAHRLVLSMYSPYLRRLIKNLSPEVKILIPLVDFPYVVLEKVVELFYYGEIHVQTSIKGKVYKALALLEVDIPQPDPPKPRTKKTPSELPTEFQIVDGQMVPVSNTGDNAIEKSLQPKQISDVNGQQPQQQQQQQQKQKQQPANRSPNSVSTEATTHFSDETDGKDGNSSGNGDENAHLKSASVTDVTVGSNGKVSDELEVADSTANGANATSSNVDLSTSETNLSLLYDDDIDGEIDELGKTTEDLFMDVVNTKN